MPLVVAMEEEKDEAVVRELILALGRIGSPDAVQALIKWAQPTGRFFGRKPSELRVAAVEALRLAATPAALGTLDRKSTRLNSSHDQISYAVFCLKKKKKNNKLSTIAEVSIDVSNNSATVDQKMKILDYPTLHGLYVRRECAAYAWLVTCYSMSCM